MKLLIAIAISLALVACDSGVGSSAPNGTFVTADGKLTLTFSGGHVKSESAVFGNKETTFQMVDGVAKFQFEGGMPMTLSRTKDGEWVGATGMKYLHK